MIQSGQGFRKANWRPGNPTAKEAGDRTIYGIHSSFAGALHFPEAEYAFTGIASVPTRHWSGISQTEMKSILEQRGSAYESQDVGHGRGKALVLKGSLIRFKGYKPESNLIAGVAAEKVKARLKDCSWPRVLFPEDKRRPAGQGRPAVKGLNFYV